jgi:tetratricopeptide (TPR) repeat protein
MEASMDWTNHIRNFIATQENEHIDKAIQVCQSEGERGFLEDIKMRPEVIPFVGGVVMYQIDRLRSLGQIKEAAVLEILLYLGEAVSAELPEKLEETHAEMAAAACRRILEISHKHGFAECEARFLRALGTRELELRNWGDAEELLREALKIHRKPEMQRKALHGRERGRTLQNLGVLLERQNKLAEAMQALKEAVTIYSGLAGIDRPLHLGGVYLNLASILRRRRKYREASEILTKAIDMVKPFRDNGPPECKLLLASLLNSYGNLFADVGRDDKAKEKYDEAERIRNELGVGDQ